MSRRLPVNHPFGCANFDRKFHGRDTATYGQIQTLLEQEAQRRAYLGYLVPGITSSKELENEPDAASPWIATPST